jgi:hypothetical protein
MQDLIAKMDSKTTANGAATGDMIHVTAVRASEPRIVKHHTVAESGITTIVGSVTAAGDLKAQTTLTCKDAAKAKELAGTDDRLKQGSAELTKAAAEKKAFAAMADAVKNVKVATKDQAITVTAQAKADVP